MKTLIFRDVKLRLNGFAGIEIGYANEVLCIDVLEPKNCTHIFYTHSHPRHYRGDIAQRHSPKIYSPFTGNIVKPGDEIQIGFFNVKVMYAYNREIDIDRKPIHIKGSCTGYIATTNNVTVYHMGDTDLIDEIIELKNIKIDILLIPIEGLNVMNCEEASEAVKSLRPAITIPIHFTDINSFYRFRDLSQPYTQIVMLK
uniref:MBL fold metallo-hydrolase n=1 Tax=Ignisphaera aggregans TaxID=334771 RepID=A0A7C5XHE4_9CREN